MAELKFIDVDTDILKEHALKEQPRRVSRTPAVWVTLKSGDEVRVRLLPPWTDEGHNAFKPYLRIFQHWDVGPEGKRVICPQKMSDGDKSCYVCEQIAALYKTGDPIDEKRAQRMRAGQSFIYQVIERGDEFWQEHDEAVADDASLLGKPKVKFLRLPWTAHKDVLDFYNDPNYGNISHPISGIDLQISRSGAGLDTKYGIKCVILNGMLHKVPVFGTPEAPEMDLLTNLINNDLYTLEEHPFFKTNTYDETMAMFQGQDPKEFQSMSEGKSASPKAGLLMAADAPADPFEAWVAAAQKFPAMTRAEVAEWGSKEYNQNWNEKQISGCYGDEPDHDDDGCQACPVRGPCSSVFFSKNGRYSVSGPESVAAPAPAMQVGGKGSKPAETSSSKEEGVDDMVAFLEKQAKG